MAINLNEVPDFEGLPVGEHTLKITDYKAVTNEKTGNNGFEFKVQDRHGRSGSITIWTTKDNGAAPNLISLKRFAKACGIREDQMGRWEPNVMAGRYFLGHVEPNPRNPKYTVIERFEPAILATAQASAKSAPAPIPAPVSASSFDERQPGEDDLPF